MHIASLHHHASAWLASRASLWDTPALVRFAWRALAPLAVCALFLTLLAGVAMPAYATTVVSGTGWSLDDAGVFTLSANVTGTYTDYDKYGNPTHPRYEWESYAGQIKEVRVAEGVTEIPTGAFSGDLADYSNLRRVTMSSTVKSIGLAVFYEDTNLTDVKLNDGLESIGHTAFCKTGITEIALPPNVEYGSDVFNGCKRLKSVTIPRGSTWGGNAQFYDCASLETVTIEDGVTSVPNQFLSGCISLKYVWIYGRDIDIDRVSILHCTIIGYKGSGAEHYVEDRKAECKAAGIDQDVFFHAIDGSDHAYGPWATSGDKRVRACTICGAQQTEAVTPSTPTVSSVPMYRLYNPNSGEHFYTAKSPERDNLISVGWSYEGVGWTAPSSGDPVYRLYNPNAGDHHYTTSASERDALVSVGWNYEGIGWYSGGSKPLWRQYNPNAKAGAHNYTTSKDENDYLVSVGWRAEGIGWYGL